MNLEEIDKWLGDEYGVSYTRLEELLNFEINQHMKYQDESKHLKDQLDNALRMFDEEAAKNEKAIEYINKNTYYADGCIEAVPLVEGDENLLDILHGSDTNG